MPVFSQIPGATCILRSGGVYRQADVFVYDNKLFAKYGGGYVMLHKEQGYRPTSAPKVTWEGLEGVEKPFAKHAHSALYFKEF